MFKEKFANRFKTAKRDERGGVLSIFVVITFITLIVFAGAGIDFMRFESERTKLQTNLDNAVLAATLLRDETDVTTQAVFDEYMSTSDMTFDFEARLTKNEISLGARSIEAEADIEVGTYFIRLVGLNSLDHTAVSGAQEVANIEVSLVLDISGSMGDNGRLEALKEAVQPFLRGLLPETGENDDNVSINVVPYSHSISTGPDLWNAVFDQDGGIGGSWCAEFEDSAFNSIELPSDLDVLPMPQFGREFSLTDDTNWALTGPYCRENELFSQVTLASNNYDALNAQVQALTAGGWTSIHDAAKWGFATLDPAMQGVFQTMSGLDSDNPKKVPSVFTSGSDPRPVSYDNEETIKIMVLMTDGANTRHYEIGADFLPQVSDVTGEIDETTNQSGAYLREAGSEVDIDGNLVLDADGNEISLDTKIVFGNDSFGVANSEEERTEHMFTELGWYDLWDRVSTRYYEEEMDIEADTVATLPLTAEQMDGRAEDLCDLAKADRGDGSSKIIVYTIAFQAPAAGDALMDACATDGPDFYQSAADSEELKKSYKRILDSIVKLRLTR